MNTANDQVESDVVVSGMSGRLPESDNIEEFARQLFAGVDLVTEDDRRWTPGIYGLPKRCGKLKDLAHFDASFFGVHAKQTDVMEPQIRLLLEVTYETIVDAGLSPTELHGTRTGVYVGLSGSEISGYLHKDQINEYVALGCANSMFANRVSYAFNLKGPSISIDTACSSAMHALVMGLRDIRAGRCDAAIVAGTNICLDPAKALYFHRLTMLSPDGLSAPFDASANGYVRSEAVVAVLLQRRCDARRVYCTVRGASINNDGFKPQGISYPDGEMQRRIAREALEEARLRPQDVVYVEAHGTGTKVGDPEEVNAIAELFCKDRKSPLLLGSIKSNMGHAEPASGLCSVAKLVLSMESGIIPGNLHYTTPNPEIPALCDGRMKVVDTNTAWQGGLVGVNSFGFGGANAHVILEGGKGSRPPPAAYPAPRLVLASGRTDEAVKRLLNLAAEHQRDAELHALLDAVHARAISGHPRRGYAVLDPARDSAPVIEVLESDSEQRPIWFVFSGMGSQWPGMARALLRLPTFAASIARSAAALEPYGVDLQYVITEAPNAAFDNVIYSFVSIAAVQVALVDVLRELNVRPDGIVGHSAGEVGCAYADGTLTAEQTVLCAYWRGRCTLDARPPPGAMAAVGLSWEDAARRCPEDIQLACHNSPDNVTISGPLASVTKFVKHLSTEGVFVKMVDTAGIAFHSTYVAEAAPLLRTRLQQVIPEPKRRSAQWLSSSVPVDQWDSDMAKLCDAEYHVNNLISPVRFADVMTQVPARALLVEVAPHALLQALLKRMLPSAAHVPLVHRAASDPLVYLLSAVGKAYAAGAQPQVSCLYPTVSWPVSRGTPPLASHVGWDHTDEWKVPDFEAAGRMDKILIDYDLQNPEDAFIAGHNIDGRVLFPAAGYIMMVWRAVAKINNMDMEQAALVLKNMQFRRATIMSREVPLRFLITLFSGSGEFEVCEGGEVVFTGKARLTENPAAERLPVSDLSNAEDKEEDVSPLDSEDIYKELRLRGYNYKGAFRGIQSSNGHGTDGLIKWDGNWITFMDTALQLGLIGTYTRCLHLPTSLQHVVIDPVRQREAVAASAATGGAVPVKRYRDVGVTVSGGVEFRGINISLAPRRKDTQAPPKLEKYIFLPYENSHSGPQEEECLRKHALTVALQLVIENCAATQLKLAESATQRPLKALLLPHAMKVMEGEPGVRVDATLAAGAGAQRYAADMDRLGVKVSNKDVSEGGLGANCHLVLGVDVLAQRGSELVALAAASTAAGFVLLEEAASALEDDAAQALITATALTLVSRTRAGAREYVLLRRSATVPTARVVLEVRDDDYTWVERLKDAMKRAESEDMRVYVWSRAPASGVQGLATCLRREPGGDRLHLYYLPGARDAFDPDAPAYKAQVQRDLAFNVLHAGVWGTFRHLPLEDPACREVQVEHAYANTLTRCDLSSLRWIESDLQYATAAPHLPHTELCRVYYSALNFRDIMLATGKLPPDTIPDLADKDCILGFEFSGCSSTGKRVMGIIGAKGLATTVLADKPLMWEVPDEWCLKEAATVPVAYATAYYALVVRGRMRRGEAVLVHAGAGGVGQAAIAVALHAGCTVFTTVGTPDKRAFLRDRFPQLLDANIGNSRDCSFEQLVLRRTRGRGVDLVLNSLAGEQLQASLRCLSQGGQFLEIGKLDLSANTAFGMKVLLKNITVHAVLLDMMCNEPDDYHEKLELRRCMIEGIAAGVVRPLPVTVFGFNQLEQAFRYMASGKHIGKVLIRVREEAGCEPGPVPTRLFSAIPRTYMHPGKSYVLVGGLGGFGLELCEWLVSRGARSLVLSSRGGVQTGYQAWCIRKWRFMGVHVLVSVVDAATAGGARALLLEAAAAAPVGGIFNLAVVLFDALLENQTPHTFRAAAKPKIDVTRALDVASRELAPELEYFVAFSSMACGRGNPGQSNYGYANSGMERLCEQRRDDGLPALAVQWGAVGDVGLAAAMFGEDMEIGGTMPQRIASCLKTLEALLEVPHAVVSSVVLSDRQNTNEKPARDLVQIIANILGFRDASKISETATLAELGVDSLMTAEVKQTLERSFDVLLSVLEIRALTFGKLRAMANAGSAQAAAMAVAGPLTTAMAGAGPAQAILPELDGNTASLYSNELANFSTLSEIMPEQALVKLPSLPPANADDKPVFMVHPIEGVVDLLRGIAAHVRGAVYGLQCVRAAPLDDMGALARFYLQRVRAAQPQPPYILLGYSFGAGVAFEMALQLEQEDCAVHLVLVDGSPAFVASSLARAKLREERMPERDEASLLAFLAKSFYNLDSIQVANELKLLPDWEARVNRVTELINANGSRIDKDTIRPAADKLHRRVELGDSYKPATRLQAPVMLFKACDDFVAVDEDYGLRALCAGELRIQQLAETHRTIVAGDAARAIADYVSKLLAQH